ncbi:DUF58 domain-containing protein [Litorilinea aerophila]|uniref:DUF58 domain-containing protein n=1 Tax=Litorilinea aerophila TaxID=1204385 RepID=A0A540VGP1_9CHLR|nr:DUF58 domain-containing protein [Litorilinea aerophila]MCC9076316.1 DUF58 domain-containing protein [Litorilinea aerophila]GIV78048.1 MAG: hypothetical protein KatS3mg050_2442 [Litorilinea sp.]
MSRLGWITIGALGVVSILLRHELLFLITVILALLAATSALWARYCLHAVSYRRHFDHTRLFFGEETYFYLEVVNAKILPLPWLRIDDEIPAALDVAQITRDEEEPTERRRMVTTLSLRWYERVTRRYRIRGTRRGVWHFGPAQLRSGDIFGFEIRRKSLDTIDRVVVYPRMVPVTQLGLPAHHPLGAHRSPRPLFEDPIRLMGARDYTQGDNFRHIHWKATAHRQRLQTKLFEPSTTHPLALFLNADTAAENLFGLGQDWDLLELAITVAASVGREAWEAGYPVGLYSNALIGARHVRIRPRTGPRQLPILLEALARIDSRGRWPIANVLQTETASLPYGSTVVLVTALLDDRLERLLLDLPRRELGVALITLGRARPSRPLVNVRHFHVGTEKKWDELETLALAG